jgi:hypothetical protein
MQTFRATMQASMPTQSSNPCRHSEQPCRQACPLKVVIHADIQSNHAGKHAFSK